MTGLPDRGPVCTDDLHVLWERRFWLGDTALLLPGASAALRRRLSAAPRTDDVCDVVCGPTDIVLHLAHPLVGEEAVLSWLTEGARTKEGDSTDEPRLHRFAVRYGGPATDLEEISRRLGMTAEAVIALHAQCVYEVAALGFAPGFAYLAETPPALRLSRKSSPRLSVAAGAVAVAHRYTAIYPRAGAAGWWIVGHVGADDVRRLWLPEYRRPSLLSIGDRVLFHDAGGDGRDGH